MSVERDLEAEAVGHLDLTPCLTVKIGTRVRDVLHKVATDPKALGLHVEALMTPDPDTVTDNDRVGAALRFMNQGHYRHVPVVDGAGRVLGTLTDFAMIRFLSDRLPDKIYNRAPDDQVARAPEGA